jgi:hypothetical protein
MNFLHMLQRNIRTAAAMLAVAGLPAAFYYAFDIRYPNHFVGDMYGMEVMWRGSVFIMTCLPLCVGLLLAIIGWKKEKRTLTNAGLVLADVCSLALLLLTLNVYHSRAVDDIRKTYPQKSTVELLRIAEEKKDQFAIYEIIARKDASAIPALSSLLLDGQQDARIRLEAAHALGQLGGHEALITLEKAAAMAGGNRYLRETIRYSLENIDRQ